MIENTLVLSNKMEARVAKRDNIATDVRLIYRDLAASKRAQIERRLINYMLQPPEYLAKVRRILEVATQLQRRRNENRTFCDQVWHRLVQTLFDRDELIVFLAFMSYYQCRNPVTRQSRHERDLNALERDACNRVQFEFFRYAGETTDRSLRLAISLVQNMGTAIREDYAGVQNFLPGHPGAAAFHVIRASASLPRHDSAPISWWISNVINAMEHNKAAEDVWLSLYSILTNAGISIPQVEHVHPVTLEMIEQYQKMQDPTVPPVLRFGPSEAARFEAWTNRYTSKSTSFLQAGLRVLQFWRDKTIALAELRAKYIHQITYQPRRGLRPGGYDHVEIHVSPLHNAGVRSVLFYPEGDVFPNSHIRLLVAKFTQNLVSIDGTIQGFRLNLPPTSLENASHPDQEELRALLEHILVDVMYRIIAEDWSRDSRTSRKNGAGLPSDVQTLVRPHLRRLCFNHSASQDARRRASNEFGYNLPDGVTFVRGHYRNGLIEHEIPTDPIVVYTDRDLMEVE